MEFSLELFLGQGLVYNLNLYLIYTYSVGIKFMS
jgi:hypothetical protein